MNHKELEEEFGEITIEEIDKQLDKELNTQILQADLQVEWGIGDPDINGHYFNARND